MDADQSASTALVRDRFTWMLYLQIATYGYFLYAFTPAVPLLGDDEHVSRAIAGLHGTGLALGAVMAGVFGMRLVVRFGRGAMLWAAMAVMCGGVVILVSCRVVEVTVAGAVVAGFGGTLLVNASTAAMTAHHRGAAGGAALTEGNGIGSGVGLFAPLVIGGFVAIGVGWRAGMLVTLLLAVIVAAVFGRSTDGIDHITAPARRSAPVTPAPGSARVTPAPRPARANSMSLEFWRSLVVVAMTTAVEFSMTIWSSDVLHRHDGLSKGVAATGVTAIVLGMTVGRLTSGRLALRHSLATILLWAYGVTGFGFAVFWVSDLGWLAFVGLFFTGLGMSVHFPLAITRSIGFSEGRPDRAAALVSLGNGIAVGLAPFGLGALADTVGSHTAILVVPVFVAVAAIGVATTRRAPEPVRPDLVPLAIGDV